MKSIKMITILLLLINSKFAYCQHENPLERSIADSLRDAGDLKGTIAEFQKIYDKDPLNRRNTYNLACALSLDGQADSCFKYLTIAVKEDTSLLVLTDPDLISIRDDNHFKDFENKLVSNVIAKQKKPLKDIEYAKSLCRLMALDQSYMYEIGVAVRRLGFTSPVVSAMQKLKTVLNERNQVELEDLIGKKGWPKNSNVGSEAASAAFYIIQHSDAEKQQKYIGLLKERCEENEASWVHYAMLYDRMKMNQKLPQRYGTQMNLDNRSTGAFELYTLEDKMKVNEWRKEVGLPPLSGIVSVPQTKYTTTVPDKTSDRKMVDKLKKIETGIVEFTSPESIINPEKFDSPHKNTIEERMKTYKVPGVSIAVFDDTNVIQFMTYGVLRDGTADKVTEKTIFQAASTSKLITAVIVLHYAQKGLLNLDADVNKYLKRWKVPENEFTKNKKVTLRYLLTHQSGLPTTNFSIDEKVGLPSLTDVIKGENGAGNKPAIPTFEPGSQWQYSNIGYVLIQLILEDAVKKPFSVIAYDVVFNPLKMKSSTFTYPLRNDWKKREALPHDQNGKFAEPIMHPSALAHGGLMTTPNDLALFTIEIIKSYQGKSGKIINKNYADELLNKECDLDPKIFGFPVGEGLGVMLLNKGNNTLFTHPGSNLPGTNCWLIASLQTGRGAVVMTNGAMGEVLAIEIITAISKEYNW